jgi:hypothetical protein
LSEVKAKLDAIVEELRQEYRQFKTLGRPLRAVEEQRANDLWRAIGLLGEATEILDPAPEVRLLRGRKLQLAGELEKIRNTIADARERIGAAEDQIEHYRAVSERATADEERLKKALEDIVQKIAVATAPPAPAPSGETNSAAD